MKQDESQSCMPQVSVIIPCFNCREFLPGAIETVLSQGVDDLEIIVVDDGSSDGSFEWLQQQARRDSRVRVFRQRNGGPASARNIGISKSCAPLVAFLDADDRWRPGKLKAQIALHQRWPDVSMSFTDYRHLDEAETDLGNCFDYWPRFAAARKRHGEREWREEAAVAMIFAENIVGTSTVMARRIALQNANGFEESLHSAQDWELWIRLALRAPVACIDSVCCDYLMRRGSVTGNLPLRLKCMESIIRKHEAAVCAVDAAAYRYALARLNSGWAEHWRREGHALKALLRQVLATVQVPSPRSLRASLGAARELLRSSSACLNQRPPLSSSSR